uniref:Tumor necrosis factor receptor superfamily member 4-like n=1 Tax=Cyprinodon variegatus TaxID=28743 RepID=A0A3Q2EHD5_CYPVA
MILYNLLIITLTLNEIIVDLDAFLCKKGQRVFELYGKKSCLPCQDGYFQPTENQSKSCTGCERCDEARGSRVKVKCTKETNTVCECRPGFVPFSKESSICICEKGSGLKDNECLKCQDGYFSSSYDTSCQKWKDCKSAGIKKEGTPTSDVICNEVLNGSQTTTAPAVIKKVFPSLSITHPPHEGVQTQKTLSNTTTAPVQPTTVRKKVQPSFPSSNTSNHVGTAILTLGIVGLLVLTVMTCKLHITPCWRTKQALQTKDSLCRRPVEESGDGSESSLKLNPEP